MITHARVRVPALLIAATFLAASQTAHPQSTLLVDFGGGPAANAFGLAGWNTPLTSANLSYSSEGPGGVRVTSDPDELTDYRGVRGTPRTFAPGERIVATWYNAGDDVISFTARVSFTDTDVPEGGTSSGNWYTMRNGDDYRTTYCRIAPRGTCRTMFVIVPSGVHATAGTWSVVNISLSIEWQDSQWKTALLCDRIDLHHDADLTPPSPPGSLVATPLAHNAVALRWDASVDNTGIVDYLVLLDDEVESATAAPRDTVHHLEPATTYRFRVVAVDQYGNQSAASAVQQAATHDFPAGRSDLIPPSAFTYLGAVRLPPSAHFGGEALAYDPLGDPGAGAQDGYPGSVFTTSNIGPEDGLIGEMSIPPPRLHADPDQLEEAVLLQDFVDIRPADVRAWPWVDVWNVGLACVPDAGGSVLYSTWSYYYQVGGDKTASLSACRARPLAGAARHGAWFVHGSAPPVDAQLNDYLFALQRDWADAHTGGRRLVTGRNREGGLSGLGPSLWAVAAPSIAATPPAPGTALPALPLLQYGPVEAAGIGVFPQAFDGFHYADWLRAAAWLQAGRRHAVLLAGNKARGQAWYGYTGEHMRHDWTIADVPTPDFGVTDPDGKGWRGHDRIPLFVLYDPDDLARVAAGTLPAHAPQPYAAVRPSRSIFFGSIPVLRDGAYDPDRQLLYLLEFCGEREGLIIMHCWHVETVPVAVDALPAAAVELRVHPQPATDMLHVEIEGAFMVREVTLHDLLGRVVHRGTGSRSTIDLRSLPPGVYMLRLTSDAQVMHRPCVIMR